MDKYKEILDELFRNHIELVKDKKGQLYFRIKNSKGRERSYTSASFEDFWKEGIEIKDEK